MLFFFSILALFAKGNQTREETQQWVKDWLTWLIMLTIILIPNHDLMLYHQEQLNDTEQQMRNLYAFFAQTHQIIF